MSEDKIGDRIFASFHPYYLPQSSSEKGSLSRKQKLEELRETLMEQLEQSVEIICEELKQECTSTLDKMHAVVHLIEIIDYIIDQNYTEEEGDVC